MGLLWAVQQKAVDRCYVIGSYLGEPRRHSSPRSRVVGSTAKALKYRQQRQTRWIKMKMSRLAAVRTEEAWTWWQEGRSIYRVVSKKDGALNASLSYLLSVRDDPSALRRTKIILPILLVTVFSAVLKAHSTTTMRKNPHVSRRNDNFPWTFFFIEKIDIYICIFIKLHITAQSGPVMSSALCYLDWPPSGYVCVSCMYYLTLTA